MTLEELKAKLEKYNVPERWYSLDDGLKPDALIIYKNYSTWEFFYLDERGGRNDERIFFSANDVYDYLWQCLEDDLDIFRPGWREL